MFVDEVKIKVMAGDGGSGCTSFRREKFVPMGGPDGGNGGRGGNIIFVADKSLKTLIDLKYKKIIKGHKGNNGEGSNRNGKNSEDIIIKVPLGTTVYDDDTNLVIKDIINDDDEVIVAHGGRGGRGNRAFATHENPAPKFSEKGEMGEIRFLRCELKVLADVGIVGMPSVGKSTLLSVISSAKPKIASYHFTTLSPNLGVVKLQNYDSYTVADLPGLIEGASEGVGLGDKFLKHAYRCKIILHMVDMSAEEGRNPVEDYRIIRGELEKYSSKLANKKEIVVASKMDNPDFAENLEQFKKAYPKLEIYPISSFTNEGIDELLLGINDALKAEEDNAYYSEEEMEENVYIKFKEEKPYTITREDDLWVIRGKEIEKLFSMTKFEEEEGAMRFGRKLRGMGVEDELARLGAKPGDDVVINDYLFTYKG
ncbi:MAG: GTPase ObgE [Firmicutes bacterium]|nr:GTPase ObgE [Bacillota bacterium]